MLRYWKNFVQKRKGCLSGFKCTFYWQDAIPDRLPVSCNTILLVWDQHLGLQHRSFKLKDIFNKVDYRHKPQVSMGDECWKLLCVPVCGPLFFQYLIIQAKTMAISFQALLFWGYTTARVTAQARWGRVLATDPTPSAPKTVVLQNSGSRMFMLRVSTLSAQDQKLIHNWQIQGKANYREHRFIEVPLSMHWLAQLHAK